MHNLQGTNYELVDALTSGGMIKPGGTAIHCNFTAKPANQDSDSSIKLFFGEILTCPNAVPIVTYCDILNGGVSFLFKKMIKRTNFLTSYYSLNKNHNIYIYL
jgi:uncharacterized protein DUF3615